MNEIKLDDYLFLLFSALLIFSVALSLSKFSKKEEKKRVVTVIRCEKCGKEEVRDWKEGDFIGKYVGTCECGGRKYIALIYVEGEEKEGKRKLLRMGRE